MSLDLRILMPSDKESIMDFAREHLHARETDPTERQLLSWTARWRGEALDYYLPQGWSFGAFEGKTLQGFVMGQPLIFFRGLTQTLWIEHGEFATPEIAHLLLDCAYRWSRDKHLQCVLVEGSDTFQNAAREWKQTRIFSQPFVEIKSARY